MFNRAINKKGIDGIAAISQALLGRPTGQCVLVVNQGGLANRDAVDWMKEHFESIVLPYLSIYPALNTKAGMLHKVHKDDFPHDDKVITGKIVCNISDGVMGSTSGLINFESQGNLYKPISEKEKKKYLRELND